MAHHCVHGLDHPFNLMYYFGVLFKIYSFKKNEIEIYVKTDYFAAFINSRKPDSIHDVEMMCYNKNF